MGQKVKKYLNNTLLLLYHKRVLLCSQICSPSDEKPFRPILKYNTKSLNKNLINKSKFVFLLQLFIFGKIVSHQKDCENLTGGYENLKSPDIPFESFIHYYYFD
jgi:hypothetical protein